MTICERPRETSQGTAKCHHPEHGDWADHIAYLEAEDGQWFLVTWNGSWTDLRPIGGNHART